MSLGRPEILSKTSNHTKELTVETHPLDRRIDLISLPTPLQELKNMSLEMNGVRLFMKRDDLTGLGLGGNKSRKLEYLMREALDLGCDTVITEGAPQSNHCRQTAAAAARLNLDCHLVLGGESPAVPNGNMLIDELLGATLHLTEKSERGRLGDELQSRLESEGRKVYRIPVGGSNATGALGYVRAAEELRLQMKEAGIFSGRLVIGSSSGGTQAGLEFGIRHYRIPLKVSGMRIDKESRQGSLYPQEIRKICEALNERFGSQHYFDEEEFGISYRYNYEEYGSLGRLEMDAIRLLARREGIVLDPVYTARAFGGLLKDVAKGHYRKGETVIFLHSGGVPALFAYADRFFADR